MTIHVIGGGTVFNIRPHLALSAPAYGKTARFIERVLTTEHRRTDVNLHLTKMAGGDSLETNHDIAKLVNNLVHEQSTKCIYLSAALCDFTAELIQNDYSQPIGKQHPRLQSKIDYTLELEGSKKIIGSIRQSRKDIYLIGFKTTSGVSIEEQFEAGLKLLKTSSCNLVLCNDVHTRINMVITPEQAKYCVSDDRQYALRTLVAMATARMMGTFTRSTVVDGEAVSWNDQELIPDSLRQVVNHCIKRGAYRPFLGSTVGHFAVKVDDKTFITSKRKTDFNNLDTVGMVKVEVDGDDRVIAHGAKPSVGGQSQRIIFKDHPDADCIVHCHVPLREDAPINIPVRSQREVECGSHACGVNTSRGLQPFQIGDDTVRAVMLDRHGPNIVFNRNVDPQRVIEFIEQNFDLTRQTSEL